MSIYAINYKNTSVILLLLTQQTNLVLRNRHNQLVSLMEVKN